MAGSTYSTNLKIELMTTGENSGTWGDVTNTNLGTALEQAVVGYGNPDYVSDANLTISITNSNAAQAARALVLNVTSVFGSLTQTRELVVPTIQKQYIVQNNTTGGQSITVKTSAGTGITVPNGRKAHLYVDGTNVIQMFDFVDINGGAIDGTTIGASSASTGAFTTLNASGATTLDGNVTLGNASGDTVTVTGTIASNLLFTDNTYDIGASGATRPRNLYLAGAATIGGNLSVGGTLTLTGGLTLNGNVTVGDSAADTLTINSTITSNLIFTDNTYDIGASGATRPRNLYLAGNATIGGSQTLTGALTVDSTTDSSSTTTGSIQTDGGVGIAKNLYVGGATSLAGNLTFATDNAYDIGASGANRARTGYFGTSVITPALTVSGLTSGRVTFATTGGQLTDSQYFTFNGQTVAIYNSNSNTGPLVASYALNVQGGNNLIAVGQANAEAYVANTASSKYQYYQAGTQLALGSINSTVTSGCLIDLAAYNATNGATNVYFGAVAGLNDNGSANFVIGRRASATTWSESVRVDQYGNTGFGTAVPYLYGKVAISVGNTLGFSTDQYGNALISTGDSSSNQALGLNIQVGNALSLGTTKGASLNLYGNTQDGPTGSGIAGSILLTTAVDSAITSPNGMQIQMRTGSPSTLRVLVDKSGNVGFGNNTNLAAPFHLYTATAQNTIFEQSGTAANYQAFKSNGTVRAYIGLENSVGTGLFGGGTAYGLSIGTPTTNGVAFATNNQVRLKIDGTNMVQVTSGNNLNATRIISNNFVAGNIAPNVSSVATWYLLAANEVASPGYMMMGSIMAGSYTSYSFVNLWIQKVYSSTSVNGSITGLHRDGSFSIAIQRVTYGGTNYIALYISGSNPEIDVMWTGYQLNAVCTNNEFVPITSGVTVLSTVASY